MRYKILQVYIANSDDDNELLNQFLQANRIISIDREFVGNGENSFWSFCIVFDNNQHNSNEANPISKRSKRGSIDYRETLSPQVFAIYAKLRSMRNQLAEQQNIPPYAIFSNEQLAQMSQLQQPSLKDLANIEGIGEKRLDLYADQFIALIREQNG